MYAKKVSGNFWKTLDQYTDLIKEKIIDVVVKIIFDRYFSIIGACPNCAEIKSEMIFNKKEKFWYCAKCYERYKKERKITPS